MGETNEAAPDVGSSVAPSPDPSKPWEGHEDGPFAGLHAWFVAEMDRLRAELMGRMPATEPVDFRDRQVIGIDPAIPGADRQAPPQPVKHPVPGNTPENMAMAEAASRGGFQGSGDPSVEQQPHGETEQPPATDDRPAATPDNS